MRREDMIKDVFHKIKMSDNKAEDILKNVMEYKKENQNAGNKENAHEIKPAVKRHMGKRALMFLGGAAAICLVIGSIIFVNKPEKESSMALTEGIYSVSSKDNITEESIYSMEEDETGAWKTDSDSYRYVYEAEYNDKTGEYILYTGKERIKEYESRNGIDTVIYVGKGDILNNNFTEADSEDILNLDYYSNMWVYVDFDGIVLETYPCQLFADRVILCGSKIPQTADYPVIMDRDNITYSYIETFLRIPTDSSADDIYNTYELWEKIKTENDGEEIITCDFEGAHIIFKKTSGKEWSKMLQIDISQGESIKRGSFEVSDTDKIKEGMTYNQVKEILGEGNPDSLIIYHDEEGVKAYVKYCYYSDQDTVGVEIEYSGDDTVKSILIPISCSESSS